SLIVLFFFSSRRRHTRCYRDWSSDVCSSDLAGDLEDHGGGEAGALAEQRAGQRHRRVRAGRGGRAQRRGPGQGDRPVVAEQPDRSEERRVGKESRGRWGRGATIEKESERARV